MNKELNLQIPDSLFTKLSQRAEKQGVSIEALCLSILGKESLVEPALYSSLSNGQIREEIRKVIDSDLPRQDIQKRIKQLELQILRYIR